MLWVYAAVPVGAGLILVELTVALRQTLKRLSATIEGASR
jgi:hypothetical protein